MRALRVYGANDKVRKAQWLRWCDCCQTLWESEWFRLTRHHYWLSMGVTLPEPRTLEEMWARRFGFVRRAQRALKIRRDEMRSQDTKLGNIVGVS